MGNMTCQCGVILHFELSLGEEFNLDFISVMDFLEFKDKMFGLACFNTRQVYAWEPGFDRNNFVRWTRKGLIISLRQGYYTFPEYNYKSIRKELMFGYEFKPTEDGRSIRIACLEKALLDLLYLYPFINTVSALLDLRLDEDVLRDDLNTRRLNNYALKFENRELLSRVHLLMNTYAT